MSRVAERKVCFVVSKISNNKGTRLEDVRVFEKCEISGRLLAISDDVG
jgi:hypothetical protein